MPEGEEDGVCPSCKQTIPAEQFVQHLAGLDGARPGCPRQDLVEIVARARRENENSSYRQSLWSKPFSRTW